MYFIYIGCFHFKGISCSTNFHILIYLMTRSSGRSGVHHTLCTGLHHPLPIPTPTDSSAFRDHRKDASAQYWASTLSGCTGPAQTPPRQQRILHLTSPCWAWPLIEQPVASVHANNPTALYYLHCRLSSQSEAGNDSTVKGTRNYNRDLLFICLFSTKRVKLT